MVEILFCECVRGLWDAPEIGDGDADVGEQSRVSGSEMPMTFDGSPSTLSTNQPP